MKTPPRSRAIATALCALLLSMPAWATWDGKVLVNGSSLQSINGSTISFETAGETVPVTVEGEDDDGNVILSIGFDGDRAAAGTLTISGPNGTQRISTPAAGPGQSIHVNTRGPGSANLIPNPPSSSTPVSSRPSYGGPRHQLGVSAGILNLGGTNLATAAVLITDPEQPNLSAPFDINADGGSISYSFNLGRGLSSSLDRSGLSSNLTLGFSYSEHSGDDSSDAFVAAGGVNTGILYTNFDSGSTGAAAGPSGASSLIDLKVDWKKYELRMQHLCNRDLGHNISLTPSVVLGRMDFDYSINSLDTFDPASGLPPADFFDARTQQVSQNIYDVGIGGRLMQRFGRDNRFDVFGDAMLHYYRNKAELRSVETVSLGDPLDPGVYEVAQDETENDFGMDLGIGMGWNITDHLRSEMAIKGSFGVPVASIVNPTQGDFGGDPTHVQFNSEDQVNYSLSFRFGW